MKTKTKTKTIPMLLALLMSLALVGPAVHAAPQSRSELKARFEHRLSQIDRLKEQGRVGESWTGFLEPVKGESDLNEQAKKLVAEENADRKKLYAMIADDPDVKDGRKRVPADKVAERNGRRNFRNADPDEFLKTRNGLWIQRNEIVQLKREARIGETREGYLDVVDGESLNARQRAVFDEENNIRRESYERQANKSNTSPSEEAQRAGEKNIAQAAPGEYIKDRKGRWERKA